MFFWLFKICSDCKFTTDRGPVKYCFYFENSRSFKWAKSGKLRQLSWYDEIKGAESIFTGLWTAFWWLFIVGRQKSIPQISTHIISCCLQHYRQHLEFQKATHASAFCFCLGVFRPFASDTSPKWIDREGLGKRRTRTRQGKHHACIAPHQHPRITARVKRAYNLNGCLAQYSAVDCLINAQENIKTLLGFTRCFINTLCSYTSQVEKEKIDL